VAFELEEHLLVDAIDTGFRARLTIHGVPQMVPVSPMTVMGDLPDFLSLWRRFIWAVPHGSSTR